MTLENLPDIQIKRYARATRLRLRIDAQHIKVTAPLFCTNQQIQAFITESEQWILTTWKNQQEKRQHLDQTLPTVLQLFNQSQLIQIEYKNQKNNFIFDQEQRLLYISSRQPEVYLKDFVAAYAKQYLPLFLQHISQEIGLKYMQCHIRQPKTRWGSCSAKHDIMLNSGVILFSEAVVRYLCVHELAHTKFFNHSAQFWNEVAQHDPNFRQHRQQLKQSPMPYWWNI